LRLYLQHTHEVPFFNYTALPLENGGRIERRRFFDQDAFGYCLTGLRRNDSGFSTDIPAQGYVACNELPRWTNFDVAEDLKPGLKLRAVKEGRVARGNMTFSMLATNSIACGVVTPQFRFLALLTAFTH
jgi:hypothetical protein